MLETIMSIECNALNISGTKYGWFSTAKKNMIFGGSKME